MSLEPPQTPRPLRRVRRARSSARVSDSTTSSYWDALEIEDVPELTRTQTPLTEKPFPLTPNNISSVDEPFIFGGSGSPLPDTKEAILDIKSEFTDDGSPSLYVPAVKYSSKVEEGTAHPARRLFQDTTRIFSLTGDEYAEKKTSHPEPSVKLDKSAMDFNFSQPNWVHNHSYRRISSGFRDDTKVIAHTFVGTKEMHEKQEDKPIISASRLDQRPALSQDAASNVESTTQVDDGQHLHSANTQPTRQDQLSPKRSLRNGTIRVGNTNIKLVRFLPYDALQILREDPGRCVSFKVKDPTTRCSKSNKWTHKDTEDILNSLQRLGPLDIRNVLPYIQLIINKATCTSGGHRKVSSPEFEKLQNCISDSLTALEAAEFNDWVSAFSDSTSRIRQSTNVNPQPAIHTRLAGSSPSSQNSVVDQTLVKEEVDGHSTFTVSQQNDATTSVDRYQYGSVPMLSESTNTAIGQGFVQRILKYRIGLSIERIIRIELTKRLTPVKGRKDGYIYIYWSRGNFGYVKIGVTEKSVEHRLKEWVRDCGHEIESHSLTESGSSNSSVSVRIPHVYRVERLVHAELYRQNLEETKCEKCGKKHEEWFKVSPEMAKKVVLKWSQWMRDRQPYESWPVETVETDTSTAHAITQTENAPRPSNEASTKTKNGPKPQGPPLKSTVTEEEIQRMCQPLVHDSPVVTPKSSRRRSNTPAQRNATALRRSARIASRNAQMELDFSLPSIFETSS